MPAKKRRCKVVYYRDRKREFRWRFVAVNGRIVADSAEGYKRIIDCENSFALVRMEEADIERIY